MARVRNVRNVAVLVLLPLALLVACEGRPTVTVSPAQSLLDRQVVTVTGSGFEPGTRLEIDQCTSATSESCTYVEGSSNVTADSAGGFRTEVELQRILPEGRGLTDCAARRCTVAVQGEGGDAPIHTETAFRGDVPAVRVHRPVDYAVVRATTTVVLAAYDDALSWVDVRITGPSTDRTVAARSSPYGWLASWDTTTVADGSYQLVARARDRAGNVGTDAPVPVRVSNASYLVASPATGLSDGQAVQVSGRGLRPSSDYHLGQCNGYPRGETFLDANCTGSTVMRTDAAGRGTATVTVRREFLTRWQLHVTCAEEDCSIVGAGPQGTPLVFAPLSFAP